MKRQPRNRGAGAGDADAAAARGAGEVSSPALAAVDAACETARADGHGAPAREAGGLLSPYDEGAVTVTEGADLLADAADKLAVINRAYADLIVTLGRLARGGVVETLEGMSIDTSCVPRIGSPAGTRRCCWTPRGCWR
jgi:hypothetical protein